MTAATCAELFAELLALDHSRRQPWGALHGEAVACYVLQHPSAPRAPRVVEPLHERIEGYAGTPPSEARTTRIGMTIHDVAVDGTFPAAGYPERLRRWAQWILAGRAQAPDDPA